MVGMLWQTNVYLRNLLLLTVGEDITATGLGGVLFFIIIIKLAYVCWSATAGPSVLDVEMDQKLSLVVGNNLFQTKNFLTRLDSSDIRVTLTYT